MNIYSPIWGEITNISNKSIDIIIDKKSIFSPINGILKNIKHEKNNDIIEITVEFISEGKKILLKFYNTLIDIFYDCPCIVLHGQHIGEINTCTYCHLEFENRVYFNCHLYQYLSGGLSQNSLAILFNQINWKIVLFISFTQMLIQIIYATSQNNVFALKDSCKLPWTCPEDLKNFKKITSSGEINILIMGSATFKSLPVIKNRLLFVLSRNDNDNIDNITYFKSFDEAIKIASLLVNRKIYTISVIGGIDIIKEALLIPLYDKIIYHSIIPITINDERNRYLIIDQSNFKFVEEINHSTYKLLKYII